MTRLAVATPTILPGPGQSGQSTSNPDYDYTIPRRFVADSKLRLFLAVHIPTSGYSRVDTAPLSEILQYLKEAIQSKGLYDENNTAIILCNLELENALDVKAIHVSEVREFVCKQLSFISEQPLKVSKTPEKIFHYESPPSITLTSNIPVGVVRPMKSGECTPTKVTAMDKANEIAAKFGKVDPDAKFWLKKEFLQVLQTLPDVKAREVFTYEQLTKLLSAYILEHKRRFFDSRNIKVCIVHGDILGKAFGVKAFHRTQVTALLKSQLIVFVSIERHLSGANDQDRLPSIHDNTEEDNLDNNKIDDKTNNVQEKRDLTFVHEVEAARANEDKSEINLNHPPWRNGSNAEVSKCENSVRDSAAAGIEVQPSQENFKCDNQDNNLNCDNKDSNSHIVKEDISQRAANNSIQNEDNIEVSESEEAVIETDFTEYDIDSDENEEIEQEPRESSSSSEPDSEASSKPTSVPLRLFQPEDFKEDFSADSERDSDDDTKRQVERKKDSKIRKCNRCKMPSTLPFCEECFKYKRNGMPERPTMRKRKLNLVTKTPTKRQRQLETDSALSQTSQESAEMKSNESLCTLCFSAKKNAGIVHGKLIHQISCYSCAKKLYRGKKACPVCRRKIDRIAKIISG